jgi:hypothetical protein
MPFLHGVVGGVAVGLFRRARGLAPASTGKGGSLPLKIEVPEVRIAVQEVRIEGAGETRSTGRGHAAPASRKPAGLCRRLRLL